MKPNFFTESLFEGSSNSKSTMCVRHLCMNSQFHDFELAGDQNDVGCNTYNCQFVTKLLVISVEVRTKGEEN
jgi:hypothetical protein